MASNIIQRTTPYLWTSAGDDIIYQFDFESKIILQFVNSSGFLKVQTTNPFSLTLLAGDTIFITDPSYFGLHTVVSDDGSNFFTTSTPYTTTLTGGYAYHLRIPEFTLYKGFNGEIYDIYSPYTVVSNIKPSPLYDENGFPYIEINVKGLCSRMFDIQPMTEANSDGLVLDFNMCNAIRLVWDGLTTDYGTYFNYTLVLNSTITNAELLQKIVNGFYLTPTDKLLVSSQGVTFGTYMKQENIFPILHKYINGVLQ